MTIILISLVWLAVLVALVYRLATRPERMTPAERERSPSLLHDGRASFEQVVGEVLRRTPAEPSSKPATAKHVGDRSQQDLYVRP